MEQCVAIRNSDLNLEFFEGKPPMIKTYSFSASGDDHRSIDQNTQLSCEKANIETNLSLNVTRTTSNSNGLKENFMNITNKTKTFENQVFSKHHQPQERNNY